MKRITFLISGFFGVVFSTSAENCPDPALLQLNSTNTEAIISARMIDGTDLYICSITKTILTYECEDSKLGEVLNTNETAINIRGTYFRRDTINFSIAADDKTTYTINLNETYRSYLTTQTGVNVPTSNGTCVGILDISTNQTVTEIINVTINLKVIYLEKDIYLLPTELLEQTILLDCSYTSGYCYHELTNEHTFWKVATEATPLKDVSYGYAIGDALVYTMMNAPLLKYLFLKQGHSYVAVELVKESSFFPNSSVTHWLTDHQVNVSFDPEFTRMLSSHFRAKYFELEISGSKEEAFNRIKLRCAMKQLEQRLKACPDALLEIDYYFLIFVTFMAWSFIYAMFSVMANYFTLRKLGNRDTKMLICALSHATTIRYVYKRQHEVNDYLNVQMATFNTKTVVRFEQLEHIVDQLRHNVQILETVNLRTTSYTYDYARVT